MTPIVPNLFIFDSEVFKYDWFWVFKEKSTGQKFRFHNDYEGLKAFMDERPVLAGFNNKHYDQFILKACLLGFSPENVKWVNDYIIGEGHSGWEIQDLKECRIWFDQYDLKDDCRDGISLKAFEANIGMDIRESTVPFDIDRPLTEAEIEEVFFYCDHDVDATDILDSLRVNYLKTKIDLGATKGMTPIKSLYATNAKLTSIYLDARPPEKPWTDERAYVFPKNILWQYIPDEVYHFFDDIHDLSIPSGEYFKRKLEIMVGECPVTLAFGGIHGAIPKYREESTETRKIRNKDVASYYPHLVTLDGFCSRNIPNPQIYVDTIEDRVKAKKAGDSAKANALKLVLNTTYGAMLNGKGDDAYNDLYDPLMGRSVCITGQLRLLELAYHCLAECPTLKVIQVNTDGIMVSFDDSDEPKWQEITQEWQDRTGFELEEDFIRLIVQKDVNNYLEIAMDGGMKPKGGDLVRGVLTNGKMDFTTMGFPAWNNLKGGAFNINNKATIVAEAVIKCLYDGTPVADTINGCTEPLRFQLIAKTWAKCGNGLHDIQGTLTEVQRVNRVYASKDWKYGRLYMIDPDTGNPRKISGLPMNCIIDNDNHCSIDDIDKRWYIREAQRLVNNFLGVKKPTRHTRTINLRKKELFAWMDERFSKSIIGGIST